MKAAALFVLSLAVSTLAVAPLLLVHPEKLIKDSYLVILNDNVTLEERAAHITGFSAIHGANYEVKSEWTIINGYHAIASKDALASILADPRVSYVEQDQVMSINYEQDEPADFKTGGQSPVTGTLDSYLTQTGLPTGLWGLARIWQNPVASTTTYRYWASAGEGVDAYIIDTGVNLNHNEFTGRLAPGAFFVETNTNDGNGHGTHVGSSVAGTVYGVAKKATIIPVKVLSASGSGSNAGVVNGINWCATNHRTRNPRRGSVANMSLGGGASATTDNAVAALNNAGVTVVVAAGNENQNACNVSPARAPLAWTVGSIANGNARSSFSNWGNCVNIFAPGSNILGAWIGSATATNTISGTSMASPHAAGGVALYLGYGTAGVPAPAAVKSALESVGYKNVITNPGTNSPNNLLSTNFS